MNRQRRTSSLIIHTANGYRAIVSCVRDEIGVEKNARATLMIMIEQKLNKELKLAVQVRLPLSNFH